MSFRADVQSRSAQSSKGDELVPTRLAFIRTGRMQIDFTNVSISRGQILRTLSPLRALCSTESTGISTH